MRIQIAPFGSMTAISLAVRAIIIAKQISYEKYVIHSALTVATITQSQNHNYSGNCGGRLTFYGQDPIDSPDPANRKNQKSERTA
jgi:hypothetical protein